MTAKNFLGDECYNNIPFTVTSALSTKTKFYQHILRLLCRTLVRILKKVKGTIWSCITCFRFGAWKLWLHITKVVTSFWRDL